MERPYEKGELTEKEREKIDTLMEDWDSNECVEILDINNVKILIDSKWRTISRDRVDTFFMTEGRNITSGCRVLYDNDGQMIAGDWRMITFIAEEALHIFESLDKVRKECV